MSEDFVRNAAERLRQVTEFPEVFFERVIADGSVRSGGAVLDLHCGGSNVARGLAVRGCALTGIDHSAPLLAQAAELDRRAGVTVRQWRARVENADFPPASFDAITAAQCWSACDRPRTLALARGWLRPGGRLLIAQFQWLPLAGNVVQDSERLILARNPGWTGHSGSGLHPLWLKEVAEAGFADLRSWSLDVQVPCSHVAWRSRVRSSPGVAALGDEARVRQLDVELMAMLSLRHPGEPMVVPHRLWVVSAAAPGGAG
ncbi:class I SAM-dependent methyltransferase [Rhodanobacter sp. PCA2]|uniref:methyltransferase domain-containing protein n=1 Tax=Rhodanobacter sp. PCA2 TaxID=2006117 RepID=UPI0015E67A45|nr:SAM-dependent methyltransferase [Rhodanobacter sp. PCA2]